MTNGKEQIAETASNTWVWVINSNSSDLPTLQDIIEEAMQEYSDLQNKELTERVKELESQLTELKERHKSKLTHAFKAGRTSINTTFEQWYDTFVKQPHEND